MIESDKSVLQFGMEAITVRTLLNDRLIAYEIRTIVRNTTKDILIECSKIKPNRVYPAKFGAPPDTLVGRKMSFKVIDTTTQKVLIWHNKVEVRNLITSPADDNVLILLCKIL